MLFESIDVRNVRILSETHLSAEPGLNLIYGPNGSGKTSILEAINLLSRAKSFRTNKLNKIIKEGQEFLQISARVQTDDGRVVTSGVEKKPGETSIRFAGESVRQASHQVRNLPVLVLTPESQGLMTASPKQRRHWLDWLMFHVEPGYLKLWSDYQRALRHRNHLLRIRARKDEFKPWETRMSQSANELSSLSLYIVSGLEDRFKREIEQLLTDNVGIGYYRGWDQEQDLALVLERQRGNDMDAGYTRCGPHRSDLKFLYSGQDAGEILSRGQSKLFMVALLLAQAELINSTLGKRPVVLIDDVFAELDDSARRRLAQRLSEMSLQTFITGTGKDMKNYCSGVFHVKQGFIGKQELTEN